MPTGQPPIPEVTSGPFSAAIQPPAPRQMQVEQAQSQGPQFNGAEGKTGAIAGLLTKFLEGASVGRARADAKKLQDQATKQSNDAQQLNNYIQMAASSGKDPEAIEQLQQEALKLQGHWVTNTLEESGKSNPFMKGLHSIAQGLMGGPPADEGTAIDPKTGKKKKTKTAYEGPDPEKINDLWGKLASAPSMEQASTQKSVQYTDKAKSLIDQAQASHPGTPVTQEEAQAVLSTSGLLTQGDNFAKKYGVNNPVGLYLDSFKKEKSSGEKLDDIKLKEYQQSVDEFPAGGQSAATPTTPPPSRSDFSLSTTGPASSRPSPAMAPGMITPGNIDLKNRPVVKNDDGTTSTVKTMTIEEDGKTILLPMIVNGKSVSDQAARDHYHKTGEHMGIFSTEEDAEAYDADLHNKMGWNGAPGSAQAKWQQDAATRANAPIATPTGGVSASSLQRAILTGRAKEEKQIITLPDGSMREVPVVVAPDGKIYDRSGNPIDPKNIGKPITDAKGDKIAVERTDDKGKKYQAYAHTGSDGKLHPTMLVLPDGKGGTKEVEAKVPEKPKAGTSGASQLSKNLFTSIQTLRSEARSLRAAKIRVENAVSQDPLFQGKSVADRQAEVKRRQAAIDSDLTAIDENMKANQELLGKVTGMPSFYEEPTALPPGTVSDVQDVDSIPVQ